MLSFLKKPYPSRYVRSESIWISVGVGVFIGLFLFLFKPFGLVEIDNPLGSIAILGYGVVTFIVALIFLYFIPKFFPNLQKEENWTVGKEIGYMCIMVTAIAVGNTLYNPVISSSNSLDLVAFGATIFNTFLVAVLPIGYFVMQDHNMLLKKHMAESESINLKQAEVPTIEKPLERSFIIESASEKVEVKSEQLLYIESEGNYANIISQIDGTKKTQLIRTTMKNLESQIKDEHIIRCHRSYFINLNKVIDVKGNAQGFKLSLKNCEDIVPVSRKFVPIIKGYFANKD